MARTSVFPECRRFRYGFRSGFLSLLVNQDRPSSLGWPLRVSPRKIDPAAAERTLRRGLGASLAAHCAIVSGHTNCSVKYAEEIASFHFRTRRTFPTWKRLLVAINRNERLFGQLLQEHDRPFCASFPCFLAFPFFQGKFNAFDGRFTPLLVNSAVRRS